MARTTVEIGTWSKGINNSARSHALPHGTKDSPGWACADALNIDFTDEGHALSRQGYSYTTAMDNGHSLVTLGDKTLVCQNGELGVITALDSLTITTLRTGLPTLPISYAELGGEIWWSNGTQSGRCNADNTDSPWCVPTPANIPSVSSGAGTMPPGKYRVAITHVMASGEESAASAIYSYTLASTGSLAITLPTAASGTNYFRIYATIADGTILQHYSDVPAASPSATVTAAPAGITIGNRAFLLPLPAGDILAFHNGRLLSASGNTLSYSVPYDFGLYDPVHGRITLTGSIKIVAPCEGGVFIVADKTYFYAGNDIAESVVSEILPYSGIKGTMFRHPNQKSVGWMGDNGFTIGHADGSVKLPQQDHGFIPPRAATGSTWVRVRDGMIHLVCSLDSSALYNKEVSSDFTTARVRYDDDGTTVVMNLANGATSRYSNWFFNSSARIFGDEYGVDSVGLRKLEGTTDDGTAILSVLDCGNVGFDSMQIKAPEVIYVAGKSSAPMVVDVILPDGTIYSYPARSYSDDKPAVQRHDGMKGLMNLRRNWFTLVLRNDEGSTFDISGVAALVSMSKRKI
jgi:hypothetical protein